MAIAIDGNNTSAGTSATTATCAITTSNANDIIVVMIAFKTTTISNISITAPNVAFANKTSIANSTNNVVYIYYGGWSGSGSITVSARWTTSSDYVMAVVGASGLSASTIAGIWDADAAVTNTATSTSITTTTTGSSTATANGFAVAAAVILCGSSSQSLAAGNVYGTSATALYQNHSATSGVTHIYAGMEYLVRSSTASSAASTMTGGTSEPYAIAAAQVIGYASTMSTTGAVGVGASSTAISNESTSASVGIATSATAYSNESASGSVAISTAATEISNETTTGSVGADTQVLAVPINTTSVPAFFSG